MNLRARIGCTRELFLQRVSNLNHYRPKIDVLNATNRHAIIL
jgi:hypothetical protein